MSHNFLVAHLNFQIIQVLLYYSLSLFLFFLAIMLFFKASCTELLLGSEYTGSSKNIPSFRQIYVPRPHLILSPIYIELMLQLILDSLNIFLL